MGTHLRAVPNRDREQALRLYLWNVALSSAFYGVLQGLEVTLRKAMHKQLASRYVRPGRRMSERGWTKEACAVSGL